MLAPEEVDVSENPTPAPQAFEKARDPPGFGVVLTSQIPAFVLGCGSTDPVRGEAATRQEWNSGVGLEKSSVRKRLGI